MDSRQFWYVDKSEFLDWLGLRDGILDMPGGKGCRIDTGTFQNDMKILSEP